VRLLRYPLPPTQGPLAIAGANGSAGLQLPPLQLALGEACGVAILQTLADSGRGPRVLSAARHVLLLNPRVGPDCDGNGLSDYLEIVLGLAADLDHDLVPDVCQR